ncbi:PfkB domain-containing protein [Thermincola ferriacetica]|uniref:PfkB domain protein n=2 Tax=Thermincola TaxID=278993 RepID=D5X9W4_THEPJ|nr:MULTISPECIES: sugar kinase [Thermincola]ADG83097.1 PfkB domain protein [Thermincola potens JR]KNZ70584.1 PfkB domain-containing protein [Thermincola ferriacetica]
MSKKVVTFGEIMLRLSTPGYQRFVQAESFDVTYGGGESNVAVSLANFGEDAYFVTKVPDNPIGQSAINHLRRFGVKTDYIARGGERLGIYFLETGASQRPSKVVYDRANSAIATAVEGDFDWQQIFSGAAWFHFTGITPALSDSAARLTLAAARVAKEMGLTVSCDLNYRKKLWSTEKARQVMTELMQYVDVAIGNEEDAEKVFGIKADNTDITSGELSREGYKDVARKLAEKFGFKYVAITLRESYSASDNGWSGMLYDGKDYYFSRKYNIRIVDRVGGGDSFVGGLLYALLNDYTPEDAVNFAAAASCLKHTILGDFNHVTVEEVKNLMSGDGSGRVQR